MNSILNRTKKGEAMKKFSLLVVVVLAVAVGMIGCDKRSQTEKDIDKAAADMKSGVKDAQKKMGL